MKIIIFFDLPTKTRKERKDASVFRRCLLKDGYHMLQYSVYLRNCMSLKSVEKHTKRVEQFMPLCSKGSIKSLVLTENQYASIFVHLGKNNQKTNYETIETEIFL